MKYIEEIKNRLEYYRKIKELTELYDWYINRGTIKHGQSVYDDLMYLKVRLNELIDEKENDANRD